MENKKGFFNHLNYFLCVMTVAFLTGIVLLILFKVEKLAPFGNNSLAIMDARIQYLDFFSYLKDVIEGKTELAYSFGKTLGGTNIAVFSYYLSSPINFLVHFWEKEELNTFFDIAVLIKLSLCSATCAIFLKCRFQELKNVFVVLLSFSYAMMQYNFAQSSNIMWLDGVYMLPIILLGVYKVVQGKAGVLLSISVGLAIFFNWYSAGIDCMFSIFWCAIELLYKYKISKENLLYVFKTIGKYVIYMALGVGISAALFLPTIFALREGKGNFDLSGFISGFSGNIFTLIQNFTTGATSSKGSVSLYCGSFAVIGFIAYFFYCSWCEREKKISIIMVSFAVLIFYFSPLCFAFSLLKPVGSYWYRYSYVGVFVLIFVSAQFYSNWDKEGVINGWEILKSGFGFSGILLILDFANSAWEINQTYVTIFCYIFISLVLVLLKQSRRNIYRYMVIMLSIFVIGDLCYNAHNLIKIYRARNVDEYYTYVVQEKDLVSQLQKRDSSFYRINQTLTRNMKTNNLTANYNEALAFNYNSIASYTSAPENNQMEFLEKLGYRINGAAMNIVNTSIIPADSLLGVKYIFAHENIQGLKLMKNYGSENDKYIYENPFCLPNAFIYKDKYQMDDSLSAVNPFLYQNGLYSKILGRNVEIYKELKVEEFNKDNQKIYQLTLPEEEAALYGNIKAAKELKAELSVSGEFRTAYSEWLSPSVFYIPQEDKKETIEVSIRTQEDLSKITEGQFYYIDLENYREIVDEISAKRVDSINISAGRVQGNVIGTQGDLLYLNIPYHEQWNIKCNGSDIKPIVLGDCLISIPLQNGNNIIDMNYEVKGLKPGILISICSFGLLIFCNAIRRRKCFQ